MNLQLIRHHAYFQDCYPIDKDNMMINLKTGKEIEHVYIYMSDPFEAGISGNEQSLGGRKQELHISCELKEQFIWNTVVSPKYKRLKYYFEIVSKDEKVYLFEDDFHEDIEHIAKGRMVKGFIFPWMNEADIMKTPDWVSDTVWYQIFPERFCEGSNHVKRMKNQEWATRDDQSWHEYYGGDLKGITKRLPYISELGFNGIYLNPIMYSDSNHKYDTTDYSKIDPDFGTNDDFKQLVEEAHKLGIKVMVDAVFNHCGASNEIWKDVVEKGPKSKYFSWFFVNNWPFDSKRHDTKNGDFYSFAFTDRMPKLNTNHPEVMQYLIDVSKRWVTEWNIDGIRFDVANEVSHAFLKRFRLELRQIKPDIYLLGEIWHDSFPWLMGDEFDSVMNYPFLESLNNFWMDPSSTTKDFMYDIAKCYSMYYEQANAVLFNLLDSHDTDRLLTRCNNDFNTVIQQIAVMMTMQGSPCLYYGTEIGMTGYVGKGCRKCMPWDEIERDCYTEFIHPIKDLIRVRNEYPQTKSNKIVWYHNKNTRLIDYSKRIDGMQDLHVYVNVGEDEKIDTNRQEIIFANNYNDSILQKGGVLITLESK